ncbi:MAG: hypothetical protein J5528_03695 [Firmicutes bacterium]|nr:hypothetical protein [Bacillota bacterium]
MTVFRCPHCGAETAYDPSKGKVVCEYCGSELTVEDYNAYLDEKGLYQANELSCRQCGATILSTDNTVATFCSFCGSPLVLDSRISEKKKPDYIIPFRIKKKKAYSIYRNKIDRTLLAPKWMKDEDNEQKIRGIYMPFHIYRFTYTGTYEGEGSKTKIEKQNGKKYDVTRTYEIESPVTVDYDFIPADGAASFPDSISRAVCPYSENDLEGFQLPYFAGYYADGADVPESLYAGKMEAIVRNDIGSKSNLKSGGLEIDTRKMQESIELEKSVKTAMFPVWFMSFRNKDKISYAAVNGQTGELAADIPISFRRYLAASVIVAAVISILFNLVFTLTPGNLMTVSSALAVVALIMANSLLNDTFRRKRHYDDAGYSGVDEEPMEGKPVDPKRAVKLLGGLFWMIFFTFAVGAVISLGFDDTFILQILPGLFIAIFIIIVIGSLNKKVAGIRKKKAPFWYKLFTFAKPVLGAMACWYVKSFYPNTDEYAYLAAMFSILMIILTAFDIVRAQNRFTMRDLPIFNEKRGGDE